jgi:ParB-like chromosome segregation protein Spo0J
VILDGHHRAAAAAKAGIPEVPVNIQDVGPEMAARLRAEVTRALPWNG